VMATGEAEMVSCTQLIPAALDEAAAIVEAEWMRLEQQVAASVDDHFAEPKESPAPQVRPPRVVLGVACVRRPGPPSVKGMGCRLIPDKPGWRYGQLSARLRLDQSAATRTLEVIPEQSTPTRQNLCARRPLEPNQDVIC